MIYLTTFIDSEGNRLSKENLLYHYKQEYDKFILDNQILGINNLNCSQLIEIGIKTWYIIKELGISPVLSNYLFDNSKSYEQRIGEVISIQCNL